LGNCGSPIEIEAGWLDPSRRGADAKVRFRCVLLDRDDPTKVIGRLPEPLIKPNINERDGYVPNVVYSCGSLVHGGQLAIRYGISDYATTFATLPREQVLAAMEYLLYYSGGFAPAVVPVTLTVWSGAPPAVTGSPDEHRRMPSRDCSGLMRRCRRVSRRGPP
jgi:hypothetical protein